MRSLTGADDDLHLTLGGFESEGLGEASYSAAHLAFGKLRRPLSLSIRTGVDYEAKRRFGVAELDERRQKAFARAELELFRNREGRKLRFSAALERSEVELLADDSVFSEEDLSTLELGLVYSHSARYAREGEHRRLLLHPWRLEVAPRVRFGLGLAAEEPRYERFTLDLSYHRLLRSRFEADFRVFLGAASDDTPVVEQLSLGGLDNLRGFRADAAIAELLWTLKSEIWHPLARAGGSGRIRRFLSQTARLAAFVDIGEVAESAISPTGTYAGAGLGLRFDLGTTIVSLDWGYGFETPDEDLREGKLYVSFRRNLD